MAGQIRLKIDGNLVENVSKVELGVNVAKATSGHPADARPRIQSIAITRLSDKKSDWWKWALKPWAAAFKNGEIEYLDPVHEDRIIKTVKWEGGWVSAYRENVPNIQYDKNLPMTETIWVCARVLDIDGAKIEVPWQG